MSAEENKAISRRVFEETWNQGKLDVVDEILATDSVLHDPSMPQDIRGPEGFKQFVTMYRVAFPDIHFTIVDQIAEGDKVVTRWTSVGTHQGELMGIAPTGVRGPGVMGVTIDRIVSGKCVEIWNAWDVLGMLQQLGVVPPIGKAAKK